MLHPPISGQELTLIGENIYLSAQIWKVESIDIKKKKIYVERANDGNPPVFGGLGQDIDPTVREKMLEIILGKEQFDYLDSNCNFELKDLRNKFSHYKNIKIKSTRLLGSKNIGNELWLFTGSKIFRTIQLILDNYNQTSKTSIGEKNISLVMNLETKYILELWNELKNSLILNNLILDTIQHKIEEYAVSSKFYQYLPIEMKVQIIANRIFDLKNTSKFLEYELATYTF